MDRTAVYPPNVEPSAVAWKTLPLDGGGEAQLQLYLTGRDAGPEAIRAQISEDYTVEPHFHYAAQFQVLLEGAMAFPLVRLDAPAVHYTEHNTPYGPFTVSAGHDMLVLHTRPGGLAVMRDKKRRWRANVRGRELTRCAHEVEWQPMPGYPHARRKLLIPPSFGPTAELVAFPAGVEFTPPVPEYGRYEVVYAGSAALLGRRLEPKALRFIPAGEQAASFTAGPEGVSMIFVSFDQDANYSDAGSTQDALARMEQ